MKQIIILVGLIFIVIGIVAGIISAFFINPAEVGKIVAVFGGAMIAMCVGGLIIIIANAINEPIK